jgi:hypothetical protein
MNGCSGERCDKVGGYWHVALWHLTEVKVPASGEDFSCSMTDPLCEMAEHSLTEGQQFKQCCFEIDT